ncbi:hypothetical protein BBAD15_g9280 [Beauveria bassiana D1-5]|uniref:HAUS augmin-like complex subunit 4 n=1 Tax=Beauveria bassiana D1-5 TaxID=1245745 RepID=A0A0A2VGI9_BEABA|nr:hypothetical protein BBAD15_g9280 [Beauveria bassiana D1-5]
MLPPVDDNVLENNPDFTRLYKTLKTLVLNPDGTSRRSQESKENEAIRRQADHHRLRVAKQHLLERSIANTSPADTRQTPDSRAPSGFYNCRNSTETDQSESLLDLLLILSPLLDTAPSISPDSAALLLRSKPLSDLTTLAPALAALVSANLHATALDLTRLTHPSSSPSTVQRHIPALENDYASLQDQLATARAGLFAARLRAASALTQLLHIYAEVLARLVRCLEAKHGPVAQSLELRAAEVALLARKTESESAQMLLGLQDEVYSSKVVSALRTYGEHLRDAKMRGVERVRNLQRELKEYGVDADDGGDGDSAKEKLMREMAKAHEEIGRQVDEVTLDLERLHTR